jgi:tRNA threonylcarbamoyladenosine biosynthesis protein TsaB
MTILGIDCATSIASAALVENGEIIADRIHPPPNVSGERGTAAQAGHAEILIPLIESLLSEAGHSLVDIGGIALTVGPGSFTGLRIGLSTVKGLAYDTGILTAGISTLWANAARVTGFNGPVWACLDARKAEVYAALFRWSGGTLTRLSEDSVVPIDRLLELAAGTTAGGPCAFIGDGARRYEKALRDVLGEHFRCAEGDSHASVAAAAAQLAEPRLRTAKPDPLGALAPVYLRRSEAESKRPQSS